MLSLGPHTCRGAVLGGKCVLTYGHPGSGKWPEAAGGHLMKAGAWSMWFSLAGLQGMFVDGGGLRSDSRELGGKLPELGS